MSNLQDIVTNSFLALFLFCPTIIAASDVGLPTSIISPPFSQLDTQSSNSNFVDYYGSFAVPNSVTPLGNSYTLGQQTYGYQPLFDWSRSFESGLRGYGVNLADGFANDIGSQYSTKVSFDLGRLTGAELAEYTDLVSRLEELSTEDAIKLDALQEKAIIVTTAPRNVKRYPNDAGSSSGSVAGVFIPNYDPLFCENGERLPMYCRNLKREGLCNCEWQQLIRQAGD